MEDKYKKICENHRKTRYEVLGEVVEFVDSMTIDDLNETLEYLNTKFNN